MPHEACFSKLTEADLKKIYERGQLRTVESGAIVITENETVNELCIVRRGHLRVGRSYQKTFLAEFTGPLGPGNAVGEISFLDGGGASATLIADGEVELFVLQKADIDAMIAADPSFAGRLYLSLFVELAHKLRVTNQRVLPTEP